MIEKIVYDYLKDYFAESIPVFMETPVDPPTEYILIEKTGSGEENYIPSAIMAIQSYGATLFRAAEVNELVKKAMRDIVTLPTVSRVSLNSDYNFTDTRTKKYRYQAVIGLTYKEVES